MGNVYDLFLDDEDRGAGNVDSLADRFGVPAPLARALMAMESGGRADAVSPKGARGRFQVMPGTLREMGVDPASATPEQMDEAGLGYLRKQYDRFGRWDLALAAYHAGPGSIRDGRIPDTSDGITRTPDYVKRILGAAERDGTLDAPEPRQDAARAPRNVFDMLLEGRAPVRDDFDARMERAKQSMANAPVGLIEEAGRGARRGLESLGAGASALIGRDSSVVASDLADVAQVPRSAAQQQYEEQLKTATEGFDRAQGFAESTGAVIDIIKAVFGNPTQAARATAESLAASSPAFAGAAAGAVIGAAVPLPGASVIGGIVGYLGGSLATNTQVEMASRLDEKLREKGVDTANRDATIAALQANPTLVTDARSEAIRAGLATTAVEGVVDLATVGAARALKPATSLIGTAMRAGAAVGAQGVGEGLGAAAGDFAAGDPASPGSNIAEGLMGMIPGVPEAGAAVYAGRKLPLAAALAEIGAAKTTEEVIDAASKALGLPRLPAPPDRVVSDFELVDDEPRPPGPLGAPPRPPLLTGPAEDARVIQVDSQGNAGVVPPGAQREIDATRAEAESMGLTPDVRAAQAARASGGLIGSAMADTAPVSRESGAVVAGAPQDGRSATDPQGAPESAGAAADNDYRPFGPESGSLGVPRADMPQVRPETHGPLVNFLKARGVESRLEEVAAGTLRPTQAEYSPTKVEGARAAGAGERRVLVSSDGYVVDGHHRWLAAFMDGAPVKVIRLNAPVRRLLDLVAEFPSASQADDGMATQAGETGNLTGKTEVETGKTEVGVPIGRDANESVTTPAAAPPATAELAPAPAAPRAAEPAPTAAAPLQPPPKTPRERMKGPPPRPSAQPQAAAPIAADAATTVPVPETKPVADETKAPASETTVPERETTPPSPATPPDRAHTIRLEQFAAERAGRAAPGELVQQHRDWIEAALEDGKAVPSDVLRDHAEPAVDDDAHPLLAAAVERRLELDARAPKKAVPPPAAAAPTTAKEPSREGQGQEAAEAEVLNAPGGDTAPRAPDDGPMLQGERPESATVPGLRAGDQVRVRGMSARHIGTISRFFTVKRPGKPDIERAWVKFPAGIDPEHPQGFDTPRDVADMQRVDDAAPPKMKAPPKREKMAAPEKAAPVAATETRTRMPAPEKVAAPAAAAPRALTAISDAGEKIGGARKDLWRERGLNLDDLESMTEAEGATVVNKQNVWKPDWQAMATANGEPVSVAMVKVLYDGLAAKPKANTPDGRRRYVRMMQVVRDVYGSARTVKDVQDGFKAIREKVGVTVATGVGSGFTQNPDPAALKDARATMFSVYKGRSDPFTFSVNELMRAKKLVSDGFPAKGDPWRARFAIRRRDGSRFSQQAIDRIRLDSGVRFGMSPALTDEQIRAGYFEVVAKAGGVQAMHATEEDAIAAARVLYERQLQEARTEKKQPERPHLDVLKREGLGPAIDRDVTPDDMLRDFGFRGIEWGNWAAQDERQRMLNMAYDALSDLAKIMRVPRSAVSLNGTLGLAFGARGGGRFAAHYEPGKLVINITKLRGAGSVAHEWLHALDHYFGELDRPDAYKTAARGASGWYTEEQYNGLPRTRAEKDEAGGWTRVERMRLANLRPELASAFDGVMRALFQDQLTQAQMIREQELAIERAEGFAATETEAATKRVYETRASELRKVLDDIRRDPGGTLYAGRGRTSYAKEAGKLSGKSANGYWLRPTEMLARAFEAWVFDRLIAMGARSDFLVHGVESDRFAGGGYKGNPYPVGVERERINAAFDNLVATIKTRDEGARAVMFSRRGAEQHDSEPSVGRIDAEVARAIGRQPGDIRLRDGDDIAGRRHIEQRHGDQLRRAGFASVDAFVQMVASGFDAIYQRPGRALSLVRRDSRGMLVVQLEPSESGDFYDVKTATLVRSDQFKNRVPLWNRAGPSAPSAEAAPVDPSGQSSDPSVVRSADVDNGQASDQPGAAAQAGGDRAAAAEREGAEQARARSAGDQAGPVGGDGLPSARRGAARGSGMPIRRLTRIVDGIRSRWANAPDIEVVGSAADLPDRVRAEIGRQEAGGAEAAPQGVYWNGTVYLVADQLPTEGAVVETLLHETLGHYGLRGVFGARLNPFLDRLALARPAQMREKARDYGLSLASVEERRAVAEELLAEMAQTSPELDLVQRAIAAVRAFLRDVMGLPIAWSDADIIAKAILPARRFVEQGPGPGDGAMPDGVAAARGPRLSTLLRRYGQQPASPQEAARWLSDGWRVFVAHEMDEAPIEVTSVERLLDYTYADDQMIGLPPGAGGNGPMFQRAFHGSPHRFDRFSNDFNGEGEGHAAFGYGHYFASRREIAEWYRDTLSRVHTGTFVKDGRRIDEAGALAEYFRPGRVIQGWGGADRVIRFNAPKYEGGAWSVRVVRVQRDGSPMRMAEERVHATSPDPRDIKEFLRADGWTAEKPGAIYTVDIPEDSEMLLWDRPVSEQPQLVQDAFRDYIDQRIADMPFLMRNATPAEIEAEKKAMLRQDGEDLYNALSIHQDGGDRGASAYLRERGVRGIKYLDGASRFGGTGSTFNYVVFDDSDIRVTDIRFKRPGRRTWDTPEPSKMDDFLYTLQDKQIDMKRVVQAVKAKVGQIADRWNPYLQEELYHGRTAKRVKDFLDFELRPLLTDMQMRGVALPEFEKFLHARHAEERNVQIAKINPKMPDGGSGMTTADAQAYLAGLDPAKRRAYEALAAKVDAITKGTRDGLVADGLEKQDSIDRWTKAYSNYVPLMREEVEETGAGTGMGFSVRGPASRRAMGSDKGVVDILANLAMQRERAIIRAEKNRVAKALYGLAVKNPNTEFWKPVNPRLFPAWSAKQKQKLEAELLSMGLDPVDAAGLVREPVQRYVDPRDGLVHERVNPALRGRDNVLSLRVNGEDRFLFFNATDERAARMAHSLKNLDVDQLGRVLSASAVASRWFASVNTQYNPIFGVVNLTRDVQSALFNLSTTPIAGKQAAVLGHTVSALRGIYADIRAHRAGKAPSSTWAQLWEEFQSEGGQTGFRDMWATAGDRTKALESEIRQIGEGKARGAGRAIFAWLSDYNETLENATRLAAYKVALDAGQSKQQAASIAKNLTVNFNRKGQITQQAGALYAFFNASVQGTARLAETLAGPKGRKIIAGGLILGVAQAMLLAAAGFDDDDPPEFVRERNLVIPIGGQQYVTIPMPLGLHVLPSFSRITTEWVLSGFRKPADRLAAIVSMLAETFNPIGNAGLSLQTITPTVVDPLAALAENKDFTGRPIARENINTMQPKPGFERTRDSASWAAKQLAYWLNAASGGTDFTPGLLSPTPDQIDYLVGQVTGGVGRELLKAQQTAGGLASGEEIAPYKMPLVGRFYGDASSGASESARFFDNLKTVYQAKAEMDGRRRAGESVAAYMREHPESRLVTAASQVDRDLDEMKKERREAARRGATAEQLRRMDDRMKARMAAFNRRVEALQQ